MTVLDRRLWLVSAKPRNERRFRKYGVYDAYTGELVKKFRTRAKADAFKTSSPDPHRLRVRGIAKKKASA